MLKVLEHTLYKQQGLPDSIFESHKSSNNLKGLSGETNFEISFSEHSIYLKDKENTHNSFSAYVVDGILHFGINTKGFKGKTYERNPDLFARSIAKRAFNYLQGKNDIQFLELSWLGGGDRADNYIAFEEELEKLGVNSPDEKEKIDMAVWSTWSGKLARQLGFDVIEYIKFPIENYVEVKIGHSEPLRQVNVSEDPISKKQLRRPFQVLSRLFHRQ